MKATFCLLIVLALASTSVASHFRYQTLSWSRPSATSTDVTVTLSQAWRWSAFGNPALNSNQAISVFNWGDGSVGEQIVGKVVSINSADDWFFIEQTATHTYPSLGNFTIEFNDCCRIGGLLNGNSGLSEVVQTKLVLGSSALRSPKIASLPLIPVQINQNNTIQIPIIKDDQQNTVAFTVTPAGTSGLSSSTPSPSHPSFPFTLTAGGQIKWHPTVAGLYAFQVTATATNGNSVSLDVILNVGTAKADTTAPVWITPTPGSSVHFTPGSIVTFTVSAGEDEEDDIRVQGGSMPPGSSLSACQDTPVNGRHNPCSTTFTWQTSPTDGDTIVCFQATDAANNSADQNCVSLIADVATSNPCGGPNCSTKSIAASCGASGATVTHQGSGKCATLSFAGTSLQC